MKVGLHRGSVLSTLLLVMEMISRELCRQRPTSRQRRAAHLLNKAVIRLLVASFRSLGPVRVGNTSVLPASVVRDLGVYKDADVDHHESPRNCNRPSLLCSTPTDPQRAALTVS